MKNVETRKYAHDRSYRIHFIFHAKQIPPTLSQIKKKEKEKGKKNERKDE